MTVVSRVLNEGVSECVHVTSLVCICRTDPDKKEKQEFLFIYISTNMEVQNVAWKLYVKKNSHFIHNQCMAIYISEISVFLKHFRSEQAISVRLKAQRKYAQVL